MSKSKDKPQGYEFGRPTTYDPKFCQMLIDYFSKPPYKEINKKVVTKSGDVIEVPVIEANDFPTLAGFAISINTHRETLLNWAKKNKDFFDVYKRAKDYQENYLAVNGNKGLLPPAFAIFTAKNTINWTDKLNTTDTEESELEFGE